MRMLFVRRSKSDPSLSRHFAVSRRSFMACACASYGLGAGFFATQRAKAQEADGVSVIRDTEIEDFLRSRTQSIFTAAGIDYTRIRYYLIASDELNAWASLGLRMGLNTGLILECETPNQLFGVMAHEAGHLAAGHVMRTEEVERAARAPMAISMGLGIIAAMAGATQAGAVLIGSAQTFGTLNALKYLQSQESAADAAAMRFLEASNMSSKGLVDFFYKFRNHEIFSDAERYKFFRTHPLSRERIQVLTRAVKTLPHYEASDPPEVIAEFAIIQAKLSGFLSNPIKTYKRYPETDMSFAARYSRVIADYKSSWWDKALNDLGVLIKEQENNPFLWELKGQIYFETARANLAKPAYEKALSLRPDSVLFRINLAQTLLATQDNQDVGKAVIELKTAVTKEPDSYSFHLLAQAYDTLKEPGLARLSTAESQYWAGDYQSARQTAVWSQKFLDPQSTEFRRARDIVITTSSALGVDAVEDSTSRTRSSKGEKRQK